MTRSKLQNIHRRNKLRVEKLRIHLEISIMTPHQISSRLIWLRLRLYWYFTLVKMCVLFWYIDTKISSLFDSALCFQSLLKLCWNRQTVYHLNKTKKLNFNFLKWMKKIWSWGGSMAECVKASLCHVHWWWFDPRLGRENKNDKNKRKRSWALGQLYF